MFRKEKKGVATLGLPLVAASFFAALRRSCSRWLPPRSGIRAGVWTSSDAGRRTGHGVGGGLCGG